MANDTTPAQFAHALGITESGGNPVAWGDYAASTGAAELPVAEGRFQVHPAWVWDHAFVAGVRPRVNESWDSWIYRAVALFYANRPGREPVDVAMEFHVGHRTIPERDDWDRAYAQRFQESLDHARGIV